MSLTDTDSLSSCLLASASTSSHGHAPRPFSEDSTPLPPQLEGDGNDSNGGTLDVSLLASSRVARVEAGHGCTEDVLHLDEIEDWPTLDNMPAMGLQDVFTDHQQPFYKWIRTLQKRAIRRQEVLGQGCNGGIVPCYLDADDVESSLTWGPSHHRQSSSGSSFGFVAAVKSATVSLTSASVLTRSRRNTLRSSRGHSRTDRSSRASVSGARLSEDSFCPDRQAILDPAVMERSIQRRRILEELIGTEESYIGDVRFLMNVYVTILASLPTLPPGLRSSINRNLTEIVELHEEMLGDLHRAVPHSEYTQLESLPRMLTHPSPAARGHHRWRSLDAVPEDNKDGVSWLRDVPGMIADPQTAAEVAKVFTKKMNRFFIYEEYGAKYELMIKDVASAHRTMPRWQSYQKGLEVLAASLGSANSQDDHSKKSLTIGDLLVKMTRTNSLQPIQRVCKYPLLFAELLKHTPVVDCPYSHMEIENALMRLREATAEINRATDDARIKSVLEKTWMLQDRLVFANQQLDAASKNRIRSFGHVQLCGALHVCWQTKEGVTGQYMVALLYREWLCLATASRIDQIYTIQACVALGNIKLEEVDNGRGLQCHTAPYSWKLVFMCDHQLYEMILTACTPKEEVEWRTRLSNDQASDNQEQASPATFNTLALNIKTLGTVFRKPGTIARRISIHRATTVGPKSPLCQVILKNTSVIKDAPSSRGSTQINRSQSLLTTNTRIPVLAPPRGERARLEALLSDVWTRDILPFPGITARSRSEHLVRASASSVMRKLSVVSIASGFTRRTASLASLQQKMGTDDEGSKEGSAGSSVVRDESGDTCGSPLSVIPDETERNSPSLSTADSKWEADVLGTVRRLGVTAVAAARVEGEADKTRPCTPAFRHSSANSSRAPSLMGPSLAAMVARESGKENMHSPPPESCRSSLRSRKLSSRWARVGILHRESVVQSIRSFFR
ncbi:hypothetical protein B0T26DRAFT_736899 [Lasiosphaeria miniovina]|uniref:DH domain-containing protein n=1 Tax=Lasiosphaeria miniovina TaxID=1954250 RepID=A0AA40BH48_9PEZI|nr:uncharacterized protein B0T26DRAFT_736899 [Lasiosphaeria miniovina]KAK0734140.1 hypothetical protein B0T26DRAFT_736899 [Lasiosphaeria miniovina]